MANNTELKNAIAQVIKTNGNQEITGQVLQNTLNSIISSIGSNATFVGIAIPTTNPGTPDQNVFYFAVQAGIYVNFGGTVIANRGLYVFSNTTGSWSLTQIPIIQTLATLNDVKPDTYSERDFLMYSSVNSRFEKISMNTLTGNLFNVSGFIATDGTHWADATRVHTGYLRIATDTDLIVYGESSNQYVNVVSFYDADKVYISGVTNNQGTISEQTILAANIPANAAYIRASTTTALLAKSFIHSGNIQSLLQAVETRLVALNTVTGAKSDGKLDKKIGKNLFNKDATGLIDGKYLDDIGNLLESAIYFVSDYIPVLPNATYVHSNFSMGGACGCIYDANKNFISSFRTGTVTVPANGYFIRMSGTVSNKAIQQFELGTDATSYAAYTDFLTLDVAIQSVYDYINSLGITNKLDKKIGKNLFNKDATGLIDGKYLDDIGNLLESAIYFVSDYIPVLPNATYVHSNFSMGGACGCIYDANKNFISSFRTGTVTVPANGYFIRMSGTVSNKAIQQFELGTVQTQFEDYTEYAPLGYVKSQVPNREVTTILPAKMYFVKGKQSCIYYENVLFKNLNDPTTLYFDKGINYNRQVTFNFAAAATAQTMNAQIIRNFKKGLLKAITYDVIDPAVNNGKTINVIHVGDSFTDIGTWVKECKTLLNAQGVTYNLIGTCGDNTFKAEGLSGGNLGNTFLNNSAGVARIVQVTGMTTLPSTGYPGQTYKDANNNVWTIRGGKIDGSGNGYIRVTKYGAVEADFATFPTSGTLTKTSSGQGDATINYSNPISAYFNPFINHSTGLLDITNYINFWGFGTPNIIAMQFTWNDLGDWASDTTINSLVASFKTAADHIHAAYPNVKVVYSIEPMGSPNGNRDWNGKKYSVLRFTELMLAQFEANANYNTWVKIAPSFAFVDLVNGYSGGATVTPCERYTDIIEASDGDGVHPKTGMLQIADCVSQIISAII